MNVSLEAVRRYWPYDLEAEVGGDAGHDGPVPDPHQVAVGDVGAGAGPSAAHGDGRRIRCPDKLDTPSISLDQCHFASRSRSGFIALTVIVITTLITGFRLFSSGKFSACPTRSADHRQRVAPRG